MPAASRSTRSASSGAARCYEGARRILADLEVDIDPRTPVAQLSPGQQQMVEIAKGLSHELKLLILDEPTSSLTINEGRHLFRVIRRLAAQGVAIIYVSHRMAEIFEISDRVTVMKDGRVTGVRETASVTHGELIALMVGRELSFEPDPRRAAAGCRRRARGPRPRRPTPVVSASFSLRYGEIVCLAGLLGAGRTEVCEAIFGARPIQSGSVLVDGRELRAAQPGGRDGGRHLDAAGGPQGGRPVHRLHDRRQRRRRQPRRLHALGPALARPRCARSASSTRDELRIATPSVDREVRYLSGGNQQKVLLAKWLARQPRILIVDEPTRGVDVGSKADIYRILRDLAAERHGAARRLLRPARRCWPWRIASSSCRRAGSPASSTPRRATEIAILELAAPRGPRQ